MENILEHRHYVFDSDPHFSIDPITRVITNQSKEKTKLIQYDHNSERFTFEIPRYVEGHDMSLSNRVEIHYINISGSSTDKNEDVYICEDKQLNEENGDKVVFSWLISRNATIYAGKLNFLVKFICSEEDKITYAWNTAIFTDITIANGMNNGEPIVEEYSDILQQWYDKLVSLNVVDNELSFESENPVQNKVITEALSKKLSKVENGSENKFLNEKGEYVEIESGSNVEANPTKEATEDLSKLQVGETVYDIPKNLYGEGTPTTAIKGKQGQKYIDTKTDKVYIYIDNVWVNLISGNTIKGSNGFLFSEDILKLNSAYKSNIDGEHDNGTKDDNYLYYRPLPITILNYKYAVKRALTHPEDFNDSTQSRFIKNEWSDTEKAKARETLGITSGGGSSGGLYVHYFELFDEGAYYTGYFYSTTSEKVITANENTLYIGNPAPSAIMGDFNSTIVGTPIYTDGNVFIQVNFDSFYGGFIFECTLLEYFNEVVTGV